MSPRFYLQLVECDKKPKMLSLLRYWSNTVKHIQNHTCQICGFDGLELDAHHIFPRQDYPQFMFELWNGVVLCNGCHGLAHTLYNKHDLFGYLRELTSWIKRNNFTNS